MKVLKPPRLHPGATLAVVSPASTPKPELVRAGVQRLERLGYRVRLLPHALDRGPLYFAGSLAHRLADLHAAFADPEIQGIVCTRGGWGSAELLPHLDAGLIRANPKPFVGYSDHTSLHTWLWNEAGLVTFYGPMVAADFSREDGAEPVTWNAALTQTAPWTLGPGSGLRVLRAGQAAGVLTGGCLAILAESLGTPFAARPQPAILFLEDIGTKPYQWDRMLLHLKYSGLLEAAAGIVFGDMAQCVAGEEQALLEAAILHALRDFSGPIAIGLKSGHVSSGNITLPLGVQVSLDLTDQGNPRMDLLEAAVQD